MNSRTFYVFSGSTKGMKWQVRTREGLRVEAYNIGGEIWNHEMDTKLADLDVVREDIGIYHATITTSALGIMPGTYMVKFLCNADGNDYVQVDYLIVEMKG